MIAIKEIIHQLHPIAIHVTWQIIMQPQIQIILRLEYQQPVRLVILLIPAGSLLLLTMVHFHLLSATQLRHVMIAIKEIIHQLHPIAIHAIRLNLITPQILIT
jgi:hypothetical protein